MNGINPRDFFNDELVDANISSHKQIPNTLKRYCIECDAETDHMKTIYPDGRWSGYHACETCWDHRNG